MPMGITGFSPIVRRQIQERAGSLCERCGDPNNVAQHGSQIHHRRPRGMGGSRHPDTNRSSNGLYLCGMCHRVVENNRAQAIMLGQIVPQSRNPSEVPVLRRGLWVLLDNQGDYIPVPEPATGGVA